MNPAHAKASIKEVDQCVWRAPVGAVKRDWSISMPGYGDIKKAAVPEGKRRLTILFQTDLRRDAAKRPPIAASSSQAAAGRGTVAGRLPMFVLWLGPPAG
jgi:hypothetical protein